MPKNFSKTLVPILLSVIVGFAIVALLFWLAFSKVLDKTSLEKQQSLNYKDASVEVPLDQKSIPNGFPSDFPIYPNSKITSTWKNAQEAMNGFSLVLETTDSLEDVSKFYSSELTKNSWTIEKNLKENDSQTMSFSKEGSKGFIGLVENGGRVIISLTVAAPK